MLKSNAVMVWRRSRVILGHFDMKQSPVLSLVVLLVKSLVGCKRLVRETLGRTFMSCRINCYSIVGDTHLSFEMVLVISGDEGC